MTARNFALIFGILYLALGLLGLMPGLLTPPRADDPNVAFDVLNGRLLGIFPVNMLHTLVHLAVGAWGLWAFMGNASPRTYARSLAVLFGALGVLGLIPGLNALFGLIPLHGHDIWLHFGTAAIAAYFGWQPAGERRSGVTDRRRMPTQPIANDRRLGAYDRRRSAFPT